MTAFARLSTVAANVSVQVFTPIGKGVTTRTAILLKDGEQVGKMFTGNSTDDVRNIAAQFYLDTFVDRIHDKRKATKAWVFNIETKERSRVAPSEVAALVETGKYRAGRDENPVSATPKPDNAPHGLKGRHWFHKGTEKVRLHAYEVSAHISDGFLPGRGPNKVHVEVPAVPATDPTVRCYNI